MRQLAINSVIDNIDFVKPDLQKKGTGNREQGTGNREQRGEKRLIIRQINKKFDVIPDALIEQIHQLSIEQLELLGEAFLDFSTMTDLEQWLENRR